LAVSSQQNFLFFNQGDEYNMVVPLVRWEVVIPLVRWTIVLKLIVALTAGGDPQ